MRLPHSKKEAFKQACEEEGITVSHAVRTFIDAYLRRSRAVRLKRIAKDISMTLIRNPIKTSTSIVGAVTAIFGVSVLLSAPSFADRDTQPIDYPKPVFPEELAIQNISAHCDNYFDVTAEGYVTNLEVKCGHPGFESSARNAMSSLRFEPKFVDGKAVIRKGVVYPIHYNLYDDDGNMIKPLMPR